MIRFLKYTVFSLVTSLGICTLFYTGDLFFGFSERIVGWVTLLSVFLLALMIVVWILTAIKKRFVPSYDLPMFSESDKKIWNIITLVAFWVFTICFGIRSEIMSNWARGSEIYMNSMYPVVIPLAAHFISSFVYYAGEGK